MRHFIEGGTISNCWVKINILPVLHENELKGECGIKAKRGSGNYKNAYKKLKRVVAFIGLTGDTNINYIIHPDCKTVDDSNSLRIFYEEESESRAEVDNEKNEQENEEGDDTDDTLIKIKLTKAT